VENKTIILHRVMEMVDNKADGEHIMDQHHHKHSF